MGTQELIEEIKGAKKYVAESMINSKAPQYNEWIYDVLVGDFALSLEAYSLEEAYVRTAVTLFASCCWVKSFSAYILETTKMPFFVNNLPQKKLLDTTMSDFVTLDFKKEVLESLLVKIERVYEDNKGIKEKSVSNTTYKEVIKKIKKAKKSISKEVSKCKGDAEAKKSLRCSLIEKFASSLEAASFEEAYVRAALVVFLNGHELYSFNTYFSYTTKIPFYTDNLPQKRLLDTEILKLLAYDDKKELKFFLEAIKYRYEGSDSDNSIYLTRKKDWD